MHIQSSNKLVNNYGFSATKVRYLEVKSSTVVVWKSSVVIVGGVRSSPTVSRTSSLLPAMSLTVNQMTTVSPSVKDVAGMLMTCRSCVGGTLAYSGGPDNPIPPSESTTKPTEYPRIPVTLSILSTVRQPKLSYHKDNEQALMYHTGSDKLDLVSRQKWSTK